MRRERDAVMGDVVGFALSWGTIVIKILVIGCWLSITNNQ